MTISMMRRDGWRIRTLCTTCWLECWVSLDTLIRLNGGDLILWDQTTRCRRYMCDGRAMFQATPPGEQIGLYWPLQRRRGNH